MTDNEQAAKALDYAVSVIDASIHSTRDRLSAAKLVLDFTKSKPAQKSEVKISQAEEILAAIGKEVEEEDET